MCCMKHRIKMSVNESQEFIALIVDILNFDQIFGGNLDSGLI